MILDRVSNTIIQHIFSAGLHSSYNAPGHDVDEHFTIRVYIEYPHTEWDKNRQGHTVMRSTYSVVHVYKDGTFAKYPPPVQPEQLAQPAQPAQPR
jgi:hypothetical protein